MGSFFLTRVVVEVLRPANLWKSAELVAGKPVRCVISAEYP